MLTNTMLRACVHFCQTDLGLLGGPGVTRSGNRINYIAPGAFADLTALQMTPEERLVQHANWTDNFGIGLWPHAPRDIYFGDKDSGGEGWANLPITLSPNPARCDWKGPSVVDFNCSFCALGYEATSASNVTCVKPAFGPYKGWAADLARAPLQLQGKGGANTNTTTLEAGRTYTIAAPALDPKETKFAGYAQPFTKIRYELDFSRGAEVDIGCGTSVVGDTTKDERIPKSYYSFPSSCREVSYQWPAGRGDLHADPPELGFYPQKCQRFHRFIVTRPGRFTFVSALLCVGRRWSSLRATGTLDGPARGVLRLARCLCVRVRVAGVEWHGEAAAGHAVGLPAAA